MIGWIASVNQPNQESSSHTTSLCINETFDLKKFCEIDEIPKANQWTNEVLACEIIFRKQIKLLNIDFKYQNLKTRR